MPYSEYILLASLAVSHPQADARTPQMLGPEVIVQPTGGVAVRLADCGGSGGGGNPPKKGEDCGGGNPPKKDLLFRKSPHGGKEPKHKPLTPK